MDKFARLFDIKDSQLLVYKTFTGDKYQIKVKTSYMEKEYSYTFGYDSDKERRDSVFKNVVNTEWAKEVYDEMVDLIPKFSCPMCKAICATKKVGQEIICDNCDYVFS